MLKTSSVVNSQWLANNLDRPDLVIVDCRFKLNDPEWGHQQYLDGHIPGANYLNLDHDLSKPVTTHGGRHPLPDLEVLAQKLGALGIGSETLVVAYDDSRFAFAARLWWLLCYMGHERVALLDGGFASWCAAGYPLTDTIPTPNPTRNIYQLQPQMVADIESVKSLTPEVVLIDSRESDRYLGLREPIDPVAGHIPGAVNSPWMEVTDSQGYLLPLETHQKLWQPYAQAEKIIVYCGSGVTACVNLFSLQLAGFSGALLYPGGWSDWCSYLVSL